VVLPSAAWASVSIAVAGFTERRKRSNGVVPLNAGAFPPGEMDDTFGPEVKFTGTQKGMKINRSPKEGFQFFGAVKIDGRTEAMTVGLHDINGKKLFSVDLPPRK